LCFGPRLGLSAESGQAGFNDRCDQENERKKGGSTAGRVIFTNF
jgi:hypothetical protein